MYYLYRYYDEERRLLYVGITDDFERRDKQHLAGDGFSYRRLLALRECGFSYNEALCRCASWRLLMVKEWIVTSYDKSLTDMLKLERFTIQEEKPLLNVSGTPNKLLPAHKTQKLSKITKWGSIRPLTRELLAKAGIDPDDYPYSFRIIGEDQYDWQ